jgi:hypothetical protein
MGLFLRGSKTLFTAQPEAPAFVLAGASGWAVNTIPFNIFINRGSY